MRRVNDGKDNAIVSAAQRYHIISFILKPLISFAPRAAKVVFHNWLRMKTSTISKSERKKTSMTYARLLAMLTRNTAMYFAMAKRQRCQRGRVSAERSLKL